MAQLKKNIFANFLGNGWVALLSIIFVPIYLRFLGIEAYGLVGFYVTLQTTTSVLDFGLSTSLNREIARLSAHGDKEQEMRDLVRTLEVIYWFIAIIILILMVFLSHFISHSWVKPQELSEKSVERAVLMMGLAIAFQFPFSFYSGGLLGLQKQILFNGINVFIATFRGIGAIFILWLVSPEIQAFFGWQFFISIFQTALSGLFLWKNLSKGKIAPKFKITILKRIWGFAAGTSGTNVLAIFLLQSDKIILSKMVSLEIFGYYSLATTVANSLYLIINPFSTAVFPRFSQLVERNDKKKIEVLYKKSSKVMFVTLLPVVITIVLFAKTILFLWTGDSLVAEKSKLLVQLLIIGTFLNGLTIVPYALQLAYGWAKLAFQQTLLEMIVTVPLIWWGTRYYGPTGTAIILMLSHGIYLLVWLPYIQKQFFNFKIALKSFRGLGITSTLVFLVGLIGYQALPKTSSFLILIPYLTIILIFTTFVSLWTTALTRHWMKRIVFQNLNII